MESGISVLPVGPVKVHFKGGSKYSGGTEPKWSVPFEFLIFFYMYLFFMQNGVSCQSLKSGCSSLEI